MKTSPNGSTSITFCHSRSGKRSIEIKLSQDYINMCNMENKQNTQIHKKEKIINYKKNYKNMRKYHNIHQPGRTNCTQRFQQ